MYDLEFKTENERIPANDTKVGDLMRVDQYGNALNGHILVHGYDTTFIDLNDPFHVWQNGCPLIVKLLQPGEKIVMTVKFSNKPTKKQPKG